MRNKNLTFIKLILILISLTLFTEQSYSQSLLDLAQKNKGKSLVKKIVSIDLIYNNAYVPIAGTSIGLQIEATLKNGKQAWTGNGTKDNISWQYYNIEVEGGTFDSENGLISITGNKQVIITATLISQPAITDKLTVDPLEIKELSLTHETGSDAGTFFVTAKAILSDNSTVSTNNKGLPWYKIDISVVGASFSNGLLSIPENDHRELKDDKIFFDAKIKGQEDINSSIEIPINYDRNITEYFNGTSGRTGQTGANGQAGASGKAGSGERAGGDGGNGQRASDGQQGYQGTNGENLEIYIALDQNKSNGNDILKVQIKSLSSGKESYLKIDPINGKLNIYAVGGNGGYGGSGGAGGSGGSGGGGTVSGKAGNGGDGGNGAHGGDGGNGGNVRIYVHPSAKKYMNCIIIHTERGSGGDGGSPGSGGQCPNNCKHGQNGVRGENGRSGIPGEVNTIEKEVKFDW